MKALFKITGPVIHGKHRGKVLGFPTANMKLTDSIPSGIYISKTQISNNIYPSVTFIGSAETFDEDDIKAETYILDFSKDLYGDTISILLFKKLRDSQRYVSADTLVVQIEKDIQNAREYHEGVKES